MSDPAPEPPAPTQMVAVIPLTVTNVGDEALIVTSTTGADQTVEPGESAATDP